MVVLWESRKLNLKFMVKLCQHFECLASAVKQMQKVSISSLELRAIFSFITLNLIMFFILFYFKKLSLILIFQIIKIWIIPILINFPQLPFFKNFWAFNIHLKKSFKFHVEKYFPKYTVFLPIIILYLFY